MENDSGSETEDNSTDSPKSGSDDHKCDTADDDDNSHVNPGDNLTSFVVKSVMHLSCQHLPSSRTIAANIVTEKQGIMAAAGQILLITDTLKLFITDSIIEDITKFSNAEGKRRVLNKVPKEDAWSMITRENSMQ